MPLLAQITGRPGCAKTTRLLDICEKVLAELRDPRLVGFSSLTRASRHVAAERAASKFNMRLADLEVGGYYKTLHSLAFHGLGIKQNDLLAGKKADREWLQEVLQEGVNSEAKSIEHDYGGEGWTSEASDADKALSIWDVARNRLTSLATIHAEVERTDDKTPPFVFCRSLAARYETAKRVHHRLDFTDLLTKFGGQWCDLGGAEACSPDGEAPDLPVWFFDESQDFSALDAAVIRRLIGQPSCRWVYFAGDDRQEIYSFRGADRRIFRDAFTYAKRDILPVSYRCPAPVWDLAEQVIRGTSDFEQDHVHPASHPGSVEVREVSALADIINPAEDWLVLARTNFLAGLLSKALDAAGVPWVATRGGSHWNAPVRNAAVQALSNTQHGAPLDGGEWRAVCKLMPSKIPEGELLIRGTKTRFEHLDDAQDRFPWVMLSELELLGATPLLMQVIASGRWPSLLDGADRYLDAVARWGEEVVTQPKVRISTIHGAKGMEADNVALLTTLSAPCYRGAQTTEGHDSEQRLFYVAVTRAKRRLVVLNERRPRFRKKMPCD